MWKVVLLFGSSGDPSKNGLTISNNIVDVKNLRQLEL